MMSPGASLTYVKRSFCSLLASDAIELFPFAGTLRHINAAGTSTQLVRIIKLPWRLHRAVTYPLSVANIASR
jgi:hypothetical protein